MTDARAYDLARRMIAAARELLDEAGAMLDATERAPLPETWQCPKCGHFSPTFAPRCEGCRRLRPPYPTTDQETKT